MATRNADKIRSLRAQPHGRTVPRAQRSKTLRTVIHLVIEDDAPERRRRTPRAVVLR